MGTNARVLVPPAPLSTLQRRAVLAASVLATGTRAQCAGGAEEGAFPRTPDQPDTVSPSTCFYCTCERCCAMTSALSRLREATRTEQANACQVSEWRVGEQSWEGPAHPEAAVVVCVRVCICVHMSSLTHMHVCMHVYMCACAHVCVRYARVYVHACVCMNSLL